MSLHAVCTLCVCVCERRASRSNNRDVNTRSFVSLCAVDLESDTNQKATLLYLFSGNASLNQALVSSILSHPRLDHDLAIILHSNEIMLKEGRVEWLS